MPNILYPEGPPSIPADFTTPNRTYKKHVCIASVAIILFMIIYLGLSSWFLLTSYRLFSNSFSGGRDSFTSIMVAIVVGFLGAFMIKALFFLIKRNKTEDLEITKEDEPELFEFIYKVADDAKAPRPHKVFLSNRVNASVFYDISIINLIFPTKKNLEIGLGLINTLNLGELKSILAHEFGHFTQKSMLIGRWVYIAHQIAYQIVAKRDIFDKFLSGFSRMDFRVAWIGWILSLSVWSIRSFAEILFKLVSLTERALSREMEFNADLVAVSLTGSDALVHALYKLSAADEAYNEAILFVNRQLVKNKSVSDIYAVQSNALKHMAVILNNPAYGLSPKVESSGNSKFMIFKEQLSKTPEMWSTHPSNIDREINAKRIYIPAIIDDRSSWALFKDPEKIKNKLTALLYKNVETETLPLDNSDSIELHNKEFQRSFLRPQYRGVYLNRFTFASLQNIDNYYTRPVNKATLASDLSRLYPESLQVQLEQLKHLDEEVSLLEELKDELVLTNQGKIKYRGRYLSKKEIPSAIEKAKGEAKILRESAVEHDRLCRSVYYQVAQQIGNGWDKYLRSLATLIHYCEHAIKNIEDLQQFFNKTLTVIATGGKVSSSEIYFLIREGNNLHLALENVFANSKSVKLHSALLVKMDVKAFEDLFQPFKLGVADKNNINSWVNVVGGWTNVAINAINTLREVALDELLLSEEKVGNILLGQTGTNEIAPPTVSTPENYDKFDPDKKRELFKKTDWLSKFHNPKGILPTIGRFAVAASIILFVMGYAANIGPSKVIVYNGLSIDVIVHLFNKTIPVHHDDSAELPVGDSSNLTIETTTENGELIESFTAELPNKSRTYLYNVANAAAFYKWTAYYGYSGLPNNSRLLGASRWEEIKADYYFEEPPGSISLSAGETTTKEIVGAFKGHPLQLTNAIPNEDEKIQFLFAHALWENKSSPNILTWLSLASVMKGFPEILAKRLQADPLDIAALRIQQDIAKGDVKRYNEICEQQNNLSLKYPGNPDFYYLKCRCITNESVMDSAFLAGHNKWPESSWLSYACGYAYVQKEEWIKALACFKTAYTKEPILRGHLVEEMKRICHLLNADSVMINFNASQTPYLNYIAEIETTKKDEANNMKYAYKILDAGDLDGAIKYSMPDTSIQDCILRLAAISDGASNSIVERALALPPTKGIDASTILPAISLLAKSNRSFEKYEPSLKKLLGEVSDSIMKFIDCTKANKIVEAGKILTSMTAEMKGKTCLVGVTLLGSKAPQKWRLYASRLLLIDERPYYSIKR